MAKTECNLFRAIPTDSDDYTKLDQIVRGVTGASSDGLLHARTGGKVQTGSDGAQFVEAPDVKLDRMDDTKPWSVRTDGGTSTHDVPGWFGYTEWTYFFVPKETEYCGHTLFIKKDKKKWNRSKTVRGCHHTIRPKIPMRLDAYLGALDNLARAAVVKSIADGKSLRVATSKDGEPYACEH